MTERQDAAERIEAAEAAEPTESTDHAEPTDPIEPIEPTEPMERIDPSLAMERIDLFDRSDQREEGEGPSSRCRPGIARAYTRRHGG